MVEIVLPFWPLRRKVKAITLWPFVFYQNRESVGKFRSHERYHWRQQWRWLIVPWFVTYIVLAMIYHTTGPEHPMEREAYKQ